MANFCVKCGKPLGNNQVCDCDRVTNTSGTGFNNVNPYRRVEPNNNYYNTAQAGKKPVSPSNMGSKEVKIKLPAFRKPTFDTSSPRNFWASMLDNMGIGDPEANKSKCFEEDDKIVPDNLRSNDGEIPIRQYKFAIMRTRIMFMKAKGRLQITNKRIIFRAPGRSLAGRTLYQNEFDINQIHGLKLQRGYRFSFWNLLVHGSLFTALSFVIASVFFMAEAMTIIGALLFSIVGLITFFTVPKLFPVKYILNGSAALLYSVITTSGGSGIWIVFAAIHLILMIISMAIYCCQKDLKFLIDTNSGTPSIVIDRERRSGLLGLFGSFGRSNQNGTGYREVIPDVDADRAVREINAIISDLQTMGDLAVTKWKED